MNASVLAICLCPIGVTTPPTQPSFTFVSDLLRNNINTTCFSLNTSPITIQPVMPSRSPSRTPRRSITPRSASRSRSRSRSPYQSRARTRSRSHSQSRSRTPPRRDTPRSRSRSRSRTPQSQSRSQSRSPRRSSSSAKIVVERLTKNVTKAHLEEIFGNYGELLDVDMPMNRQCTWLSFPAPPPNPRLLKVSHMKDMHMKDRTK